MERELLEQLLMWQKQSVHMPILLRGARQVGKTHLVTTFGQRYFDNFVSINFELEPEFMACFETLKPNEINEKIEVLKRCAIVPGKTLIFWMRFRCVLMLSWHSGTIMS